MNKKNWAGIFLIGTSAVFIFCGFNWKGKGSKEEPQKRGIRIFGVWQIKDPKAASKINFLITARFEVDLDGDGAKDIWGEYSASKDRVTLIDKGGAVDATCHSAGVYQYKVSGKELRFTRVSDQCTPRMKAFEFPWKRLEPVKKTEKTPDKGKG